jgi:hypothetical protein
VSAVEQFERQGVCFRVDSEHHAVDVGCDRETCAEFDDIGRADWFPAVLLGAMLVAWIGIVLAMSSWPPPPTRPSSP